MSALPDEVDMRYLMIGSMGNSLKEFAESTGYADLDKIREGYTRLRAFLCSFDADALYLLPRPESIKDAASAKMAIEFLIHYNMAKSAPLILSISRMFIPSFRDPLLPLYPILREWGISANWAVAAAALSLMEAMIVKKLQELNMNTGGSFEDKVRRLREKAKTLGVEIPDLLAGPFYKARGKVVHQAAEPTPDELNIILRYLQTLSNALRRLST
mgnify:CR=1 FL=1